MHALQIFINIMAWILCISSGGFTLLRIIASIRYFSKAGALERALDELKGIKTSFPILVPGSCFVISLVWIIASHLA
jgi:hypothetical protein